MKTFLYLAAAFLAFCLTEGVLSFFPVFGAVANLGLLVTVVFALEKGSRDYLPAALLGGLLLDVSSGVHFGSFTFAFLVTGALVQLAVSRVLAAELTWRWMAGAVACAVALSGGLVFYYNRALFALGVSTLDLDGRILRSHLLPEIAVSLVLLYPVYFSVRILKDYVASLSVKRHAPNR